VWSANQLIVLIILKLSTCLVVKGVDQLILVSIRRLLACLVMNANQLILRIILRFANFILRKVRSM
jgi:hypothetical protein